MLTSHQRNHLCHIEALPLEISRQDPPVVEEHREVACVVSTPPTRTRMIISSPSQLVAAVNVPNAMRSTIDTPRIMNATKKVQNRVVECCADVLQPVGQANGSVDASCTAENVGGSHIVIRSSQLFSCCLSPRPGREV